MDTELFKEIYKKTGTLVGTIRQMRIYKSTYEKEIKQNKQFAMEMVELKKTYHKRSKPTKKTRVTNKDQNLMARFIKTYPQYKHIEHTVLAIGIDMYIYWELRVVYPEFKRKVEDLKFAAAQTRHAYVDCKECEIQPPDWLPPNQSLVTWHRYQ